MENPWISFAISMPPKGVEVEVVDDKEKHFMVHRCNCDDPNCDGFDGRTGPSEINAVTWKYVNFWEALYHKQIAELYALTIDTNFIDKFVESLLIDCLSKKNIYKYYKVSLVDKFNESIDKKDICSRFEMMYLRRLSQSDLNGNDFLIPIIDRYFQTNLGMKREVEIVQVYSEAEEKLFSKAKKIGEEYLVDIMVEPIRDISDYHKRLDTYQSQIKGYAHILSKIFPKYQLKIKYTPING